MKLKLLKIVKKQWRYGSILVCLLFLTVQSAYAVGSTSAISQNYQTTSSNVTQGTLLALTSQGSSFVQPASSTNANNLIGVAADNALVELSGASANTGSSTIQVVVGGTADALVSNINGDVRLGDKITASPVNGVGMRAVSSSEIVGTAQADLSSVMTVKKTVTGQEGKNTVISVGLVPVAISTAYYSAPATTSTGTTAALVPPFLQTIANNLTGKKVSPLKVIMASLSLLLGFIAATVMLYTSIKSGVVSIGRNPLAERALRRGLVDVLTAAVAVLVITVVLVYAVLLS